VSDFCTALDDLIEQPAGTSQPEMTLNHLAGWDSMTAMGFLAMADRKYGVTVSAARLLEAKTVADLAALVGVTA
jgi:acyl carrier protein